MSSLQEPATWREFLGQLIATPQERERLAAAIRVRPVTLRRWADGISKPHSENIRALLKNLPPGTYPLFMRLLLADFPELRRDELPEEHFSLEVPAEFYARAMSNLALTPQPMYQQSMRDLILQQALKHLDSDRRGLSIALSVCMPPRYGRKVRSLREICRLGTSPWPRNLSEKPRFFGEESLVGYAVGNARPCVINSRDEMTFFPVHWAEHERSVAAFPILRQARIVGGLSVCSTQEDFFTQSRIAVIEGYARLAACIFEREDSFESQEIELRIMPPYALQLPYFSDYNQRVSQKFAQANAQGQQVTLQQVLQFVWQDLEDTLLQVFQQIGASGQ